jgi:hypothetical protein
MVQKPEIKKNKNLVVAWFIGLEKKFHQETKLK